MRLTAYQAPHHNLGAITTNQILTIGAVALLIFIFVPIIPTRSRSKNRDTYRTPQDMQRERKQREQFEIEEDKWHRYLREQGPPSSGLTWSPSRRGWVKK